MRNYISEEDFLKEARPLFKSIYKRRKSGCCLHVVIDDGNWDYLYCSNEDLKHKDCQKLNELLLAFDLSNRERINFDVKTGELTLDPRRR